MKLSVRDLLSWVWQVFLSWLTAITTGIDRPLCLERSKKMVVKANDPEMAVGRTAEENTMPKEPGGGVLLREEEEVVETLSRSNGEVEGSRINIEEVTVNGSMATGEEGNESTIEENSTGSVEPQEDETSEDTLSQSSSDDSQNSIIEAFEALPNFVEENTTINSTEADRDAGNEEGNVNGNVAEESSANNNVDEWGGAGEEGNNGDNGRHNNRDDINENDEADCDDEEEEEPSEPDTSADTNTIWLLELSSREIYQKVLSPQYHCLNFRTIALLEHRSVMTAIKQLRRLIPWLGFGFKRKKSNMWLCLFPEDDVNFQMAQYDESMWDVIFNNRDQFNYLENRSMCSFVLMKAYPCTQCEAIIDTEMSSSNTSVCSPSDATMNTSEANASSTPAASAACIVNCNSVEINTCKVINTKLSENEVDSVSTSSTSDITTPTIHTKISSALPSDSSNYAPSASSCGAATRQETSVPIDAGSDSTSSTSPKSNAGGNTLGKNEFIHNYRLVFGVPHPLADEKSVNMICDVFLKELNTVISDNACIPVGSDKNNLDASVVVTENGQSESTQDTNSSSSDSQECCPENDNTVSPSGEKANTVSPSGEKAGEPTFPDGTNNQVTTISETANSQTSTIPNTTNSQVTMVPDTAIGPVTNNIQVPTVSDATNSQVPTVPETTNNQVLTVLDITDSQAPAVPEITVNPVSLVPVTNSIQVPIVLDTTNSPVLTVPDMTNNQVHTHPDTNSIQVTTAPDTTINQLLTVSDMTNSQVPMVPELNSIQAPMVLETTGSQIHTITDTDGIQVPTHPDTTNSQVPTVADVTNSQAPMVPGLNSIQVLVVPETNNGQVPMDPDTTSIQAPTVPDTNSTQVSTVSEIINSQVECKMPGSDEVQEIIAKKKASVEEQFTVLANIFASVENKDQKTKETIKNNNVNAVNRNSPHVERRIETPNTRNFINKCKTERVSFISAFSICVNAAIANTLVSCGMKNENEVLRIGHIVSHYYNLEDLTDDDWHDHDPPEEDDEDESEDPLYKVCCKRPTVSLSLKPKDWDNGVWERAHMIDQKRWDIQSESNRRSTTPVIPLNTERNSNGNDRFSTICQPQADLSISNINNLIPRFSRRLDNLESMTMQRLSPIIIFFMTNAISLNIHNNNLRFSFYHQEQFISNEMAHQYADEIVSAVNRTTMA